MDLEAETAAYEAEVERFRAAVEPFAAVYAKAMTGIAQICGSTLDAQGKFAVHAQQLNSEAARRGLSARVTVPDLGGEIDMALVLRGIELPPEMTFSEQMRRGGDARE